VLNNEAKRIDQPAVLQDKIDELNRVWSLLDENNLARRLKLNIAFKWFTFFTDFRDLMLWYAEIGTVLRQENHAGKDIATVEVLIESNWEYKRELDARDDLFERTSRSGAELVQILPNDPEKREVKDKLHEMETERARLAGLWAERDRHLTDLLKFEIYARDLDLLMQSLLKLKSNLDNSSAGESLDQAEALSKKHADMEKSVAVHEEKARLIDQQASELIAEGNHRQEDIENKRAGMWTELAMVKALATRRGEILAEAKRYFTFVRDFDELRAWIEEKTRLAQTREYLEASNLEAKKQKHVNFEIEVNAHEDCVKSVQHEGESLIGDGHGSSDEIRDKLNWLASEWEKLLDLTRLKGFLLRQAIEARDFYRRLGELDLWLAECELDIYSSDMGKDLPQVIHLTRRLTDRADDLEAHRRRVNEIANQVGEFERAGHFDADNIRQAGTGFVKNYENLFEPMRQRQQRLAEAMRFFEFKRDVEDELAWIREKEGYLNLRRRSPTTNGDAPLTFVDVKNLVQKHQTFMTELTGHEPRIGGLLAWVIRLIRFYKNKK
jgi:spectrin alpha